MAPGDGEVEHVAQYLMTSIRAARLSASVFVEEAGNVGAHDRADAQMMPAFGKMRLDAIDHRHVSAWFDAASTDKPGAANRAFEILRAMLRTARQWGDIGTHVPDACANIVKNP